MSGRKSDTTRRMVVDGKHIFRKTNPKFILLGDGIAQPRLLRPHRIANNKRKSNCFSVFAGSYRKTMERKAQDPKKSREWCSRIKKADRTQPRQLTRKKNAVRASHPNRIRKRESRLCLLPAFARISSSLCSVSAPPLPRRGPRPRPRAHSPRSCSAVAVPLGGTVSEEAATPGLPATLARFGNRFSNLLGPLTNKTFRLRRELVPFTCCRTTSHDHWQRNIHACSE
jgi:hypothetical protein